MSYRTLHAGDVNLRYHWAVDIAFPTHLRVTDSPRTLTYGGNDYSPDISIQVTGVGQTETAISTATVTLQNIDNVIQAAVEALTGSSRFVDVTLYEFWFDASLPTSATIQETVILVRGKLDRPSWTSEKLSFAIVPDSQASALKLPQVEVGPRCPYRIFKGTLCGYAGGDTTCDRSFADCTSKSNTARFGGERFIPKAGARIEWNGGVATIPAF